jgi:hypothetical protein
VPPNAAHVSMVMDLRPTFQISNLPRAVGGFVPRVYLGVPFRPQRPKHMFKRNAVIVASVIGVRGNAHVLKGMLEEVANVLRAQICVRGMEIV